MTPEETPETSPGTAPLNGTTKPRGIRLGVPIEAFPTQEEAEAAQWPLGQKLVRMNWHKKHGAIVRRRPDAPLEERWAVMVEAHDEPLPLP